MNHHVPAAITRGVRRRDVDVITALEDEAATMNDAQLLMRSTNLGRVLFSQDEDLLSVTRTWQNTGREFSGLVYAHQLEITIGKAVRDLE